MSKLGVKELLEELHANHIYPWPIPSKASLAAVLHSTEGFQAEANLTNHLTYVSAEEYTQLKADKDRIREYKTLKKQARLCFNTLCKSVADKKWLYCKCEIVGLCPICYSDPYWKNKLDRDHEQTCALPSYESVVAALKAPTTAQIKPVGDVKSIRIPTDRANNLLIRLRKLFGSQTGLIALPGARLRDYSVELDSFRSLINGGWLSNWEISAWLHLHSVRFSDPSVLIWRGWEFNSISSKTRAKLRTAIGKAKLILCPVNHDQVHWVGLFIDLVSAELHYYDSYGIRYAVKTFQVHLSDFTRNGNQ